MMERFRIAVFASGQGSNFQAIADAVAAGELDVQIGLLVCDRPNAPVIERANRANVPTKVIRPREYPSREAYEAEIVEELQAREIDLVVLAGYMRLLTSTLVDPYYGRMINIHPALLPAFPGVDGVRQALDYGVKVTGATVHFVDHGMDTGPIIAQHAVEIDEDDTEATLLERIHSVEQELLIRSIRFIREDRVRLDGRKVYVKQTG